jgi:NAD/NADP transhydrogenase beta subunit
MTSNPEILPPNPVPRANRLPLHRWSLGERLLSDQSLLRFEILLDEAFRIPGTQLRFGIDGIIGLVPGLGDVLAGVLSLVIPTAAWIRGVPYVTLARMAVNLAIGVLVGSVPFFGDVFDIVWKVNRRNYLLMSRHLAEPRRHTVKDWSVLLLLMLLLAVAFAAPVVVLLWILSRLLGN